VRVLVTGGAGFVGSHVVEALLARGDEVLVADDLSTGERTNVARGAELRIVDIANATELRSTFEGEPLDAIVHAAAEASVVRSVADPDHSERVNVGGTANVLELGVRARVRRFVFFSTGGAIYGETPVCAKETNELRPISPYGKHKLKAEELVRASGLPHAILRPANIYGPRQRGDLEGGVVAIFMQRWRDGRELVVFGDGSAERDYVYARDVARAVVAGIDRDGDGTWNIGTGVLTTVNGVIAALRTHLGEPPRVRYAAARPGELQRACVDPAKAANDALWRPTVSFVDGVGLMVREGLRA
jgi:UDP-glucose 4-epimerase